MQQIIKMPVKSSDEKFSINLFDKYKTLIKSYVIYNQADMNKVLELWTHTYGRVLRYTTCTITDELNNVLVDHVSCFPQFDQ